MSFMSFFTAAANPAGGAATQDIVLATAGAMILTTFVVVTGVLYRSGKVGWLHRLAGFSESEAKRLFGRDPGLPETTEREYLTPWTASKAEKQFLARFNLLHI